MNTMIQSRSLPPSVRPRSVVAADVQALYDTADALVVSTRDTVEKTPDAAASVKEMASNVKSAFKSAVLGVDKLPTTAEEARQLALQALSAGLLAGALDGVIAFAAQSSPAPIPAPPASVAPNSIGDDIKADLEKLMQDLGRAASEAAAELKAVGPRALRLASRAQKKVGGVSVEQSKQFPNHPGTPIKAYQAYLAGLFAIGYGVSTNDAALTILADQKP
jgi:hypothetical protein